MAFQLAFTVGLTTTVALGQAPGVTDKSILIGSCSALDGPARYLGTQMVLGATAYLHVVNDEHGVFGRKIELLALDDGYDPEKAPGCFKRMTEEGVFALGFFVGTQTANVYAQMAEDEKIPVIGLYTGAQMLYEPLRRYIVNVRASYYDEAREQVDKLWEVDVHQIGVIYQDDLFGRTVLRGIKLALQQHNAVPAALGTFARNTVNVDSGLNSVMRAQPEAVVVVGTYAPVAAIIKRAHAAGWRPQFLAVSAVGTEEFIREAGPDAEGTIITQVLPPYDNAEYPTAQLYRQALKKYYPATPPSFVSFEGFIDAMVVVEGLKRAGRELTRENFIAAVESIHNLNVGLGPSLLLNFSRTQHKGLAGVYATVVHSGRVVPVENWSATVH